MTELASAVVLPEHDYDNPPPPTSPGTGGKRRSSSTVEADISADTKRRRLSSQDGQSHSRRPSAQFPEERGTDRRVSRQAQVHEPRQSGGRGRGRDEERKRGQRLFGALLGTLSQGSNSAAQRRRADIEKRQQDKLKEQYEELDEQRKKRRDEVVAVRKKERWLYEREEMRTRHSSLRAMAHFLKTKTEPVLYYKPWELRHDDEDIIRDQIDEAEATISREVADFEARCPAEGEDTEERKGSRQEEKTVEKEQEQPVMPTTKEPQGAPEAPDAAGAEASPDKVFDVPRTEDAPNNHNDTTEQDAHRGAEDDGGVVEEGKEDTVIY